MKNLYNIGFVVLLLVVLGCNCQRLREFSDQGKTPPSSTPYVANTSNSPTSSSPSSSKTGLTMEKYNQIKNGMTYKEVSDILGGEGTQQSSSGEGKYKVETYKWDGEQYQFISVVFMGEKVYSKVQANVK